jgi:hydroxypyruvate isomerase
MIGHPFFFTLENSASLLTMKRRSFVHQSFVATMLSSFVSAPFSKTSWAAEAGKFKLHYAPHSGMFKAHAGDNVIDQINFAADQGFTAWEENGLPDRSVDEQTKIGETLAARNMKMGVFVAFGSFDEPIFVRADHPRRDEALAKMKAAVDIAKRVNAKFMTVVPGSVDQQHVADAKWSKYGGPRLREGVQMANCIELLKRCAAILEPHGLVMVLEPLNWEVNHGGTYLRSADQGYAICKAVGSPSCKILYDVYHEQITAGNIINTMDACWSEIAYLQSGDNPGRKEPGTGEMNYRNIFKHVASKSTDIIIGMEHGNSQKGKEGELAVIQAYRDADQF